MLVQSLFAQLCAPLDHVGQHFRDCMSAAEDLRDLETLKRVLTVHKEEDKARRDARTEARTGDVKTMSGINTNTKNNPKYANNAADNKNENHNIENKSQGVKLPKVSRQFGGRGAWLNACPRLEIKNLIFSYPSTGFQNNPNSDENRPILNNVSFSIPPGGYSLGIVGPSGETDSRHRYGH